MVGLLAAKLVLTPATIAFVTWIERRFGHSLAGLVFGFPLTSSVAAGFLTVEQGASFARDAATGMLAGIACLAAFAAGFAHGSRWTSPWAAPGLALVAYVPSAFFLARWEPSFWPAVALGIGSLALAARTMPRVPATAKPRPHGAWELPLRIALGTGLVVGLTAAANAGLPAQTTGLLVLFPAVTAVLSIFVLRRAGRAAAVTMLRALCFGCFAFVAFFVALHEALDVMPAPVAFVLATLAAFGASATSWRVGIARANPPSMRLDAAATDLAD